MRIAGLGRELDMEGDGRWAMGGDQEDGGGGKVVLVLLFVIVIAMFAC